MIDVNTLTVAQILPIFNQWTTKRTKRFEGPRVARERLARLMAELDMTIEEMIAPAVNGAPNQDVMAKLRAELMPEIEVVTGSAETHGKTFRIVDSFAAEVLAAPAPVAAPAAPVAPVAPPAIRRIRDAFEAPKPAKAAPKAKAPTIRRGAEGAVKAFNLSGTKLRLFEMMSRPEGVSQAEGCAALGWARCAATISKVSKAAREAGMTVVSEKINGETRYRVID